MFSSVSDRDNSQNDSDIDFISEYVMEVEDDANMSTTDTITNEDEWFVQPYQDDPIANAEWIERYNEQRRLEEDRIQRLQTRLDGRVEDSYSLKTRYKLKLYFPNMCKCVNCSTDLLVNAKECQCCMEIEACVEAVNSEQVLCKVDSVPNCITLHPGFIAVCLGVWSLRLAGRKYRRIDKKEYAIKDTENRYHRSISYREYIQLVYGFVGRRRIPLPACAYHAIRKKFWEEKEFIGYEDDDE